MHSSEHLHSEYKHRQHLQTQPRSAPQHRRNKQELSINTFDANGNHEQSHKAHPAYDQNLNPEISTPLSPPPRSPNFNKTTLAGSASAPASSFALSPAIPRKSSQRSQRSQRSQQGANPPSESSAHFASGPGPALSFRTAHRLGAAGRSVSSPAPAPAPAYEESLFSSSDSLYSDKVSTQSLGAVHAPAPTLESLERDEHPRETRLRIYHDPDEDSDWLVSDSPVESFIEAFPRIDMSNKENDSPRSDGQYNPFAHFDSRADRDSGTPPRSHGRPRDSHDLSLSPRNVTRDSLLGNMLLSLDQFSMGQINSLPKGETRAMSGFAAEPSYYYDEFRDARAVSVSASKTMTSATRTTRAGSGGRTHGCSYSSDYDPADDSIRVYGNSTRRRRSNSSSTPGFQSNLGRIDSMRERPNQRATHTTNGQRALHSRGGHGSKSSSTSSMDAAGYANVLGSQRWAHGSGVPKRSCSLELHVARRGDSFGSQHPADQPQHQRQSPWHIDFANSLFDSVQYDDYADDAAPTPNIPVGPRRQLNTMPSMPSFGRSAPMGEPLSPVRSVNLKSGLERKRSNKSSRSTGARQSSARYNAHEHETAPPPLPAPVPGSYHSDDDLADLADSAPAPHVGYEKAKEKEPVHPAAPTSAVMQPKERQSFFRRMFGGGSSKGPSDQPVATISPTDALSDSSTLLANTMSSNTSNTASTSRFPLPNGSPPPPAKSNSNPPTRQSSSSNGLQKKPSGFFRRRKKSVSISTDPLPLPPALPPIILSPAELLSAPKRTDLLTPRPAPSPVTSLRKAMDPYLNTPLSATSSGIPSPQDDHTLSSYHSAVEEINSADAGHPRSFSPDYEPDPRATIRSVRSEQKVRMDISPIPEIRKPGTPPRDVSKPRFDYERTGSFLHDNSDSDGSPQWIKRHATEPTDRRSRAMSGDSSRLALAPLQTNLPLSSPSSNITVRDKKLDRMTQDSTSTSATDRAGSLKLPIEGARTDPTLRTQHSAASIPSLNVEDSDSKPSTPQPVHPLDEPDSFVIGEPTEDDRAKAQGIFDGSEDFIPKEKAAAWMGEEGPIRQRTLRAYMDLFDFSNRSIVTSLRDVCNRLVLRAETQQVDRILVTFSQRWVDCNPNHGFKATDVIHTICYSIMLLNTDLHMADIESKMTRSQFIKNTMGTVRRTAVDAVPEAFDRPSILPGKGFDDGRHSVDHDRPTFRNSFIKLPGRAGSALGEAPTEIEECGPLVRAPFDGSLKAWEAQMEVVLKEIYASIRDERLPLFGAEVAEHVSSAGGLSVMGMLKRSPSVLSKAASENPSTRGRGPDSMLAGNSRWASKSRSRPRGFGNGGFSSSRTSFDDGSMWSPVESVATWSRASLGRTHTSMSMDSFASRFPRGDYQQSIGFANALSQAIIREDPLGSVPSLVSDELKPTQLLEDESLELAGPPWVKEGILMHKHHLDGVDKKARDRNWSEVFCVIQKGNVSIFSFAANKTTGKKGRNATKTGGVVGGGNWQENATTLGTWNLRLCLASALPPPGYSKQRPHVWALSLPTGAVHLFHVGTPEICSEFVMTVNYWSARLSTHPLVGGVSNMEYGWSDAIINNALITAINENSTTNVTGTLGPTGRQRSGSVATRSTMHSRSSSFRSVSSFDFGSSNPRTGTGLGSGTKLPGDIVTVAEWRAPTQSMRPSHAAEKEQLEILHTYVKSIEEDLQLHNALRSPMLLAFTPRGSNAQRAMANWERRSAYLLREIVKFRTYVDVLQFADLRKSEIYRERDIARRAARGSIDGDDALSFGGGEEEGDLEEERQRGRLVIRGPLDDGDMSGRLIIRGALDDDGDMTLRP